MKKLCNTEAELKEKALLINNVYNQKNVCCFNARSVTHSVQDNNNNYGTVDIVEKRLILSHYSLSRFLLESWNFSCIEIIKTLENAIFVSNKSERTQQKSPLKMTKNVFYFVLKAFFVLKIFKFSLRHFGHVGKTAWLERLTSKFMTSQPGLQLIPIHIWPNISQSKGNQTRNLVNQQNITRQIIFFKNYAKIEAGSLVPDPFLFLKKA